MRARYAEKVRQAALTLIFALAMVVISSPASQCQDMAKSEATTAFSYMRGYAADNGGTYNMGGASASFAINLKPWLGLVQDYGGYTFTGLGYGLGSTMYTCLYGPRFSLRRGDRRWTPFGQILLGESHISVRGSGFTAGENSFAVAAGGGVDIALTRHLSVRVAQVEYLRTRFDSVNGSPVTQNNFRFSAGLVVRLGTRINRLR